MKEMVGGCCVCSDDRGWPENPLVYCDGQSCTVAVHQACYGIVTVPTGPWYCRKCESQERSVKVKCELCPSKYGALKRTDTSAWAHVVCALYIPEVRFGNVTTMEPIQLQMIPAERFSKSCYICEESGKASQAAVGACMQCNKSGCKQQFHVTCAQGLGLLCEEAGNYLDNVKYCGYCQHHYSKLKKGGNVKTIPPYKPVSTENHHSDSSSEREPDAGNPLAKSQPPPGGGGGPVASTASSTTSSKRKSSSSGKSSTSSSSTKSGSSSSKSSSTHQKLVHAAANKASADSKTTKSNAGLIGAKGVKNNVTVDEGASIGVSEISELKVVESGKRESKDVIEEGKEPRDHEKGKGKKRKANSRTPTPITVVTGIESINAVIGIPPASVDTGSVTVVGSGEKRDGLSSSEVDKIKKAKTETTPTHPSIIQHQQQQPTTPTATIVAPIATGSGSPPPIPEAAVPPATSPLRATTVTTPSIIQAAPATQPAPAVNSLVVSVPLLGASLSPRSTVGGGGAQPRPASSAASSPFLGLRERSPGSATGSPPATGSGMSSGGGNGNGQLSEMSGGGGLKIVYEKQVGSGSASLPVDFDRVTPTPEIPAKRSRSESSEKVEKSRKKRGSHGTTTPIPTMSATLSNSNLAGAKRPTRSQPTLDLTQSVPTQQPQIFGSLPQNSIKESPPSSPSSESLGSAPGSNNGSNGGGSRKKGRKSAPASVCVTANSKDSKDNIKVFQNGIHAPHMLGNQLNPNSNMAQKMSDHLNSELEAHSIFSQNESSCTLVGPQLQHRVIASVRSNSTGGSSTASGGSGLSSMLGGSSGALPQTLEQLLERHWEQGSQFLMEQAQHFDIASLLTCLHQLRAENLRLEEHVTALVQRRDHLLAINARLALPLVSQPAAQVGTHPHAANNIHPHVSSTQVPDNSRQRHSAAATIASAAGSFPSQGAMENGLPPEQYPSHQHRSPVTTQPPQPSPQSVRHSPAGNASFPTGGLIRQGSADTNGRSASRSQQQYQISYQGSSGVSQQMLMRRESDLHHQSVNKPS